MVAPEVVLKDVMVRAVVLVIEPATEAALGDAIPIAMGHVVEIA